MFHCRFVFDFECEFELMSHYVPPCWRYNCAAMVKYPQAPEGKCTILTNSGAKNVQKPSEKRKKEEIGRTLSEWK
ncbi:unnamed protein product, partial [Nesidiocoris tenuis]